MTPDSNAPANSSERPANLPQPITLRDVLEAVFFPPEASITSSLPDVSFNLLFGADTQGDDAREADQLVETDEPTRIVYEADTITPVHGLSIRRKIVLGAGVLFALSVGVLSQASITQQQGGGIGPTLYFAALAIWVGLLAFEFAPPNGGLLLRGPSVAGAGASRRLFETGPASASWSRGAMAISASGLSVATYILTANNTIDAISLVVWVLSVIAWAFVAAERTPEEVLSRLSHKLASAKVRPPRMTPRRWVALVSFVAILAVATFFRFYQIDAIPGEMTSDHVEKLLDVYDVTQGQYSVFFPRNGGREAIQMYLVALITQLEGVGISHLALKLVSATEALALVPLIILLGRELVDWETGFFAAGLLAISWWDTSLGRLGLRIVLTPFVFTLLLIALIRAVRTGSRGAWIAAGVWMGIGMYSYQALRIAPLVALAAWAIAISGPALTAMTAQRQGRSDAAAKSALASRAFARQTVNLGCAALVSVALFVPLLRYWHDDPSALWNRVVNRTTSNEVVIDGSPAQIFGTNYLKALGMFNVKGDEAWIAGLPNQPALDVITGVLLAFGVIAWIIRLRLRRDPADSLPLVAGLIMLLPSALAIAFPAENPSFTRASGAIPTVFVLAAWPLSLIRQRWTAAIGSRVGAALSAVLLAALVGFSARLNYQLYFRDFDAVYRLSALNPSMVAKAVRQAIGPQASLDGVWLVGWPFWHDYRAIGIDLGNVTFDGAILDSSALKSDLALNPQKFSTRPLVFILFDEDTEARDSLQQAYPSGEARRYIGASTKHNFYLFIVTNP